MTLRHVSYFPSWTHAGSCFKHIHLMTVNVKCTFYFSNTLSGSYPEGTRRHDRVLPTSIHRPQKQLPFQPHIPAEYRPSQDFAIKYAKATITLKQSHFNIDGKSTLIRRTFYYDDNASMHYVSAMWFSDYGPF